MQSFGRFFTMVVGGCTYGLAFFSMLGFLELFLEPASDPFLSSI